MKKIFPRYTLVSLMFVLKLFLWPSGERAFRTSQVIILSNQLRAIHSHFKPHLNPSDHKPQKISKLRFKTTDFSRNIWFDDNLKSLPDGGIIGLNISVGIVARQALKWAYFVFFLANIAVESSPSLQPSTYSCGEEQILKIFVNRPRIELKLYKMIK